MLDIRSLPTLPGASLYPLYSRHFEGPCDYAGFVKQLVLSWNWSNLGSIPYLVLLRSDRLDGDPGYSRVNRRLCTDFYESWTYSA